MSSVRQHKSLSRGLRYNLCCALCLINIFNPSGTVKKEKRRWKGGRKKKIGGGGDLTVETVSSSPATRTRLIASRELYCFRGLVCVWCWMLPFFLSSSASSFPSLPYTFPPLFPLACFFLYFPNASRYSSYYISLSLCLKKEKKIQCAQPMKLG